ncbi:MULTISPECIES: DUF4411 family protein [Corynebacterium]|uniref:DUF4411 family protein n=1 Tax=Corynebacterium aurimucosum TaxID=169292 RepID=A0A2N6TPI6_9CORY|nr:MULTISPECIES: DUF4411 family protein [Corynebacterium]OFK65244.1 hypothetical protein HMPREF2806_11815 [Corynebacterium sp. HMSC076G08]OFN34266.1 hypothetical protein HMPREF2565_10430 [Corynebacterium sp. HMSC072A04]OFO18658.1 hypothetical protein HMPREF3056_02510 [Corynebacterium sp. HMSC056F09]OFO96540.1 hypothetical protein HMPREF3009_06350 [Corynebacterium sp. HMSC034H07]OFP26333.1 hypothetical protein HMPREF2993_04135 [Corynebacterium sp. HMSC068G04]
MTRYLLDSNIIINAVRLYPRDVFPSYWTSLENFVTAKTFFFHYSVQEELERRKDSVSAWFRSFVPQDQILHVDNDEIESYRRLSTWVAFDRVPRFDEAAVREFLDDAADSWLVASAHARNMSIITDEKSQPRRINRVKLPDAAAALGVQCSTYLDFLRSRGITY